MNSMSRCLAWLLLCPLWVSAPAAQGDPDVLERILVEGKENSQVWDTLLYLAEEIGPRLTGSTRLMRANTWTRDEFRRLGLKNAHLQKWGEIPVRFDRGPSHVRALAPVERELVFTAPSWSRGTDGPVRARLFARPDSMEELESLGFELERSWVLCKPRERGRGRRGRGGARQEETEEQRAAREEQQAIDAALEELGILGRLTSSSNELVLTDSIRGWRELTPEAVTTGPAVLDVRIRKSDYEALSADLATGAPVEVEVDLAHHFVEGPFGVYNTVAEIPGTERPDEVVIVSGHLDSWDGPGSQGAQDNGTGCAVTLEAARILMAVGAQPKRTIRFCLWTGEEQGLFGSSGYVAALTPEEKERISACFVDDGGTNYQGGLACIATQKDMLDEAIAPVQAAFPELPMENIVREHLSRMGASDHASFNQVGIPGFFWVESGSGGREGADYEFVHHTQHDTVRYAVPEYLVQSATCSAVVAYQLAMADTLLPRDVADEPAAPEPEDPTFVVQQGDFSGHWKVSFTGSEAPDFSFDMVLEQARDGRLRGSVSSPLGSEKIRDGRWDDPAGARFSITTEMGAMELSARPVPGGLEGFMNAMGSDMPFRAEREAPTTAAVSGRWSGLITSMDAGFTLELEVQADGTLTGRFKSSQSDSELYDGHWDEAAGSLRFEYDYPHAGRLPVSAHLDAGKLVGTIGENADFVAEREQDG